MVRNNRKNKDMLITSLDNSYIISEESDELEFSEWEDMNEDLRERD